MHTSSIRNNALHDLTLIELNVSRFMCTGGFLVGYCNGHTKQTYRQLHKFRDYCNETFFT
jgi:hypothetical protein